MMQTTSPSLTRVPLSIKKVTIPSTLPGHAKVVNSMGSTNPSIKIEFSKCVLKMAWVKGSSLCFTLHEEKKTNKVKIKITLSFSRTVLFNRYRNKNGC